MIKRDLIKDEIERIGQMMGKILEYFQGKNSSPPLPVLEEYAAQVYKEQFDEDFFEMLKQDSGKIGSLIFEKFHGNEQAMDDLAELLLELAARDKTKRNFYEEKALSILIHTQNNSAQFSIIRQQLIDQLLDNTSK